jgi:DNA replication licensing factor MCM5
MLCSASNYLVDVVSPGMRVSIVGVSSVFQFKGSERGALHVKTPYLRVVGMDMHSESAGGRSHIKLTDSEEAKMVEISKTPDLYAKIWRSISPSISGSYTVDIKKAVACLLFGGVERGFPMVRACVPPWE